MAALSIPKLYYWQEGGLVKNHHLVHCLVGKSVGLLGKIPHRHGGGEGVKHHQHGHLAHGPSSSATFRRTNEKLRESAEQPLGKITNCWIEGSDFPGGREVGGVGGGHGILMGGGGWVVVLFFSPDLAGTHLSVFITRRQPRNCQSHFRKWPQKHRDVGSKKYAAEGMAIEMGGKGEPGEGPHRHNLKLKWAERQGWGSGWQQGACGLVA